MNGIDRVTFPASLTAWLLVGGMLVGGGRPAAAANQHPEAVSKTILSRTYEIDRKYRSMMGPSSQEKLRLIEPAPGQAWDAQEVLWITGYKAVMVGQDGISPKRQEFMCHSNLDIDPVAHRRGWRTTASFSSRLFTLSQGQQTVAFPPGFGIPIHAAESLSLTTQVLNLNIEGEHFDVRHRVTIDFVRGRDLAAPLIPLFPTSAYGLELVTGKDGYFGLEQADPEKHGPGCLVGASASGNTYDDPQGRSFTGHWVVPPGREVNHTLVTQLLRIPYDTTAHYIAVHLHPFAESLTLRDLTSDHIVFTSQARNFPDRIGLAEVQSFASVEGIEMFASHEYELTSVYNNTTDDPQDSMAVMYIYLRDHELEAEFAASRQ